MVTAFLYGCMCMWEEYLSSANYFIFLFREKTSTFFMKTPEIKNETRGNKQRKWKQKRMHESPQWGDKKANVALLISFHSLEVVQES